MFSETERPMKKFHSTLSTYFRTYNTLPWIIRFCAVLN